MIKIPNVITNWNTCHFYLSVTLATNSVIPWIIELDMYNVKGPSKIVAKTTRRGENFSSSTSVTLFNFF